MVQVRLAVKVSKLEICYVLLQRHIATMSTCSNTCLWVCLIKESTCGNAGYCYSSGPIPSVHCGFPTGNGKFGCYTTQALDFWHKNISLLTWRLWVGETFMFLIWEKDHLYHFIRSWWQKHICYRALLAHLVWEANIMTGHPLSRACLLALCFGRSEFAKQNCCWLDRCHTTLLIKRLLFSEGDTVNQLQSMSLLFT